MRETPLPVPKQPSPLQIREGVWELRLRPRKKINLMKGKIDARPAEEEEA